MDDVTVLLRIFGLRSPQWFWAATDVFMWVMTTRCSTPHRTVPYRTMSLKPWWTRACCGALGSRAHITGYTPDPSGENLFIVTFEYTDWQCDVTLLPAQLLLPAGPLQQLENCRWRVFGVPQDSFIIVLMRATNGSVAVLQMYFKGANPNCRSLGTITDLAPNYGPDLPATGAECLTFTWDVVGGFPYGFVYTLYTIAQESSPLPVTTGRLARGTRTVTFGGADGVGIRPNQLYQFVLRGACNFDASHTGAPASTVAITRPGPALGSDVTGVTVSADPDVEGDAIVDFLYSDYYCVDGASIEMTPSTAGAVVTNVSGDSWRLTGVAYDTTVTLTVTATVAAESDACLCMTPGSLSVLVQIHVPAAPVTPCSALSVTGLASPLQTATCLTFTWDRVAELVAYNWVLTGPGPDPATISGTVNQTPAGTSPSVTVPHLAAATAYDMSVAGVCQGGTETPASELAGTETAPSTPSTLPNFGTSPEDAVTYTQGAGTYTAAIAYHGWTCVEQPTLVVQPAPPTSAVSGTTWTLYGLAASTVYTAYFTALELGDTCTSDCTGDVVTQLTTQSFTFTTPGAPGTCVAIAPNQLTFVPAGATCLIAGWQFPPGAYASVSYTIKNTATQAVVARATNVAANVDLFDVAALAPSTQYAFTVTPKCVTGSTAPATTVTCTTAAAAPPSLAAIPTPATSDWTPNAAGTFYSLSLKYPVDDAVCMSNLALTLTSSTQAPPAPGPITGPVQSGTNFVWTVAGIATSKSATLSLTGTVTEDCVCGPATPPAPAPIRTITVTAPAAPPPPPPPTSAAPYALAITNYAGPPKVITQYQQEGDDDVINGAGDEMVDGSFMNQWSLHDKYASQVVDGFCAYNAQKRQFTCNTRPYSPDDLRPITYNLPIASVYYGVGGDPTQQGFAYPNPPGGTDQKVKRAYSFCDSRLPTVAPNLTNPFLSFQFPPMIAFFVRLITYNWNVATQSPGFTANARQIQLALTLYGSKMVGEQWFFNAAIDGTSGEITTTSSLTSNPKAANSVINSYAFDGNQPPGWPYPDYNAQRAGWNCMERWFMYVGYVNQQLRKIIDAGLIVNVSGAAMALDDIVDDSTTAGANEVYGSCCQISAVTTDAEGNAFENTLSTPPKPPPGEPPLPVTVYPTAACNAAMIMLWNKWINQTTTAYSPLPSDWPSDWNGTIVAPAARTHMPTTPFTLPCAMSMTTSGLLPNMAVTDLGKPDFSAVSAVFNEIYDSSDNPPYRFLGAVASSDPSTPSGAGFTSTMRTAAVPTSSAAKYADNPSQFSGEWGVWDNLVGGKDDVAPVPATLCTTPAPMAACTPPVSISATSTAFTNSKNAFTPLMQTSVCTPWNSGATNGWFLQYGGGSGTCDSNGLAWALESSRYDLYNGAWAAKCNPVGTAPLSMDNGRVVQNATGALDDVDGAMVWADMSTGLKPKLAKFMLNLSTAAATRMVWMLSTQSGPFVNNMGVRFGARPVPPTTQVPPATLQDYLTFACPSPAGDAWPGWPGMKGQWYGPGTKATAGGVAKWAMDQFFSGLTLSTSPSTGLPIVCPISPTGSTEDNFGVFADFGIIEAAWARMALDLRGETLGTDGQPICATGVSASQIAVYSDAAPVNLGCYELAFVPLSWCDPAWSLATYVPQNMTPSPP
jgi:hypothetical protein